MPTQDTPPRISVIMPAYNAANHLPAAIESILQQTLPDFELVIVDDCSTDDSWDVVRAYAKQDRRVIAQRNPRNRGQGFTANRCIELSRTPLIARMDHDDVSLPTRLQRTVRVFDEHREVGLVGSAYCRWNGGKHLVVRRPPRDHVGLVWKHLFGCALCHSAVAFRRTLFKNDEVVYQDLPGTADYELWVRLLGRTRGATIPEPLVLYRMHAASMSGQFADELPAAVDDIARTQLEELLDRAIDTDDLKRLRRLANGTPRAADLPHAGVILELLDALAARGDLACDRLDRQRMDWLRALALRAIIRPQRGTRSATLNFVARARPTALARTFGLDLPRKVSRSLAARIVSPTRSPEIRRVQEAASSAQHVTPPIAFNHPHPRTGSSV